MDEKRLERALERWRRAGVIDGATVAKIQDFEHQRKESDPTRVQFATVLGLMGALLVGTGILAFLGANWSELSQVSRTAILIGAPWTAGVAGFALNRRGTPLVGRAAWILSIILVGPSLFMLVDTYGLTIGVHWILVGWGLVGLPMGHAFETRIGVGIALIAVLLAVVVLGDGHVGAFAAGAIGAAMIGIGGLWVRSPNIAMIYRVVGTTPVIATLLWINTLEGAFHRISVDFNLLLGGAAIVAVAVVGWVAFTERSERAVSGELALTLGSVIAVTLSLVVVTAGQHLPLVLGYGIVQAILFGYFITIVVFAVNRASRSLINLVTIGFLLQVGTLLVTVSGLLPGSLVLVVAGLVLLIIAVFLERSRRELLARLHGSKHGD